MIKPKSNSVIEAEVQAQRGSLNAMEFLARRYFDGRGVEQCHMQAFVWSSIATEHGVKHLGSLCDFSFRKMSQAQRDQVQHNITLTNQQMAL